MIERIIIILIKLSYKFAYELEGKLPHSLTRHFIVTIKY